MDTELYIQTIKKECNLLEQEGYIFNQIENNIYYTKDTETEAFRIRFSWLEYGNKFDTYALIAEKRFNIVEQEIQKVIGGKLDNYFTIHKSPSIDYIPNGLEFTETEKNIRFVSNTGNDVKLFAEFVRLFYSKIVLDFFNNYGNLNILNNQLKILLETKIIQSILTSYGNSTILRFYVIAIISVNNPIKDFFKETYFPYLDANLDNELNKVESDRLKLLQNNLQINA